MWVMEVTESAAFRDETFQQFHFVSMALVFKEKVVHFLASTFQPCVGNNRDSEVWQQYCVLCEYYICPCDTTVVMLLCNFGECYDD